MNWNITLNLFLKKSSYFYYYCQFDFSIEYNFTNFTNYLIHYNLSIILNAIPQIIIFMNTEYKFI